LGHDARRKNLQKGLTKGKMRAGVERKGNHTKTKRTNTSFHKEGDNYLAADSRETTKEELNTP
jgi:hypothetical protein